ncbi:MAG: hypothetical protein IPM82_27800 [Saprospiraceae bacterium]|nr:hypothetical protein [Saprospiraceae bacterium]
MGPIIRDFAFEAPIGTVELDLINEVAAPYFVCLRIDGKLSRAAKLMKVID